MSSTSVSSLFHHDKFFGDSRSGYNVIQEFLEDVNFLLSSSSFSVPLFLFSGT